MTRPFAIAKPERPLLAQSGHAKASHVSMKKKPSSPGSWAKSYGRNVTEPIISTAELQATFLRIPPRRWNSYGIFICVTFGSDIIIAAARRAHP